MSEEPPPPKRACREPLTIITAASEDNAGSFGPEVNDIMRGFGDCERPLRESVKLVEKILQEQLKAILNEAIEVAMQRKGNPAPTLSDFEILMRKKPIKIFRMRKHIRDMRLLRRILHMQSGRTQSLLDDYELNETENEAEMVIEDKYDEERTRRLFRADRISQILTGQDYNDFNEARRTSFYCRHGEKMKNKFRAFLALPDDLQLPSICLSILAYLAHETIATIVDYAILTRLDNNNRITDPFARITSPITSTAMYRLCPEVTQGRGSESIQPITTQEILEGIRRHSFMTSKNNVGTHRNKIDMKRTYLAF